MIRHLAMLDASALCQGDYCMQHTLLSMGYGMYPMCVQFNEVTGCLLFRRGILATKKDKAQRLSLATDELHALPGVQWYQQQQQQKPGAQTPDSIHIHGPSISVAWFVAHAAAEHRRVIPDLLAWTRWLHNDAWVEMQSQTTAPSVAVTTPRHVRFAQAIKWVVAQRRANKQAATPGNNVLLALAQHTLRRLQSNELKVMVDSVDGATVIGVTEQPPDA